MNRAHLNVHDAFQAFPNLSHKLSDSESTSSYCGTGGTIIWVEKPASCSSRLVIPNPSNESCLRQPEDTLLPISGANARVDVLKDGTTGPAEKSRDSMALSPQNKGELFLCGDGLRFARDGSQSPRASPNAGYIGIPAAVQAKATCK